MYIDKYKGGQGYNYVWLQFKNARDFISCQIAGKFPFRTLYDLPGLWRDLLHRDVNKWYQ